MSMSTLCPVQPLTASYATDSPSTPFQDAYKPFGLSLLAVAAARTPKMEPETRQEAASPQPLDLSQGKKCAESPIPTSVVTPVQPSVIKPAPKPVLPTCTNHNLNSNWIAMKFGAAVGPNRMSYPREFKLMVIDYYYANGQNKYRTCKEFQITKSMLNGWLQKIDKIRESRPGSLKSGRSGRRPQFPTIEKQLFQLYQTHLTSGQKVGNRWIRETARTLAQQQCSADELAGMCQFSERWLSNFKKRYRINLNRDWSSGGSLGDSSASSTTSVSSNQADDTGSGSGPTTTLSTDNSPDLSPKIEDEDSDPQEDEEEEEETTTEDIDMADAEPFSESPSPGSGSDSAPVTPVVKQEPPIHQFYRQFPWLCRRPPTSNYEPGRRGRKVQFPQVEKVLYQKLIQRQATGQRVSNRWLQDEARTLAAQLCPEVLAEATKSARCMFSEHWLHNFKKRYGVSLKQQVVQHQMTSQSPTVPAGLSQSEPSSPSTPTMATLLHMQQWLLQQCYLNSVGMGGHEPSPMTSGLNLPTMVTPSLMNPSLNLADWYQKANALNSASASPSGERSPSIETTVLCAE